MTLNKGRPIWTKETSNLLHPQKNVRYFNYTLIFITMTISISQGLVMLYSFRFALSAELNQGVIASIFGTAPAFSAIMAYFMFSEKLKRFHMIGMVLMFI